MRQTFEVQNVKCGGCAHTLKSRLLDAFGEVEVDLSVHPRRITLEIGDDRLPELAHELKKIGYPLAGETLGRVEEVTAKAKSFVSCAVGKWQADPASESQS
jgi:copper chaperone CopZ